MSSLSQISTPPPPWLHRALSIIRANGVVALPYERLFGLAANAMDPEAVSRVAAIKNRNEVAPGDRPISVVLPNIDAVALVTSSFPNAAIDLAERFWPGPLTIVVPAASGLPGPLVSKRGLIGVRVAGDSAAATLAEHAALPLTATSANRTGDKDALSHKDISDLAGVDLLVDGTVPGPPGSTVVDASATPVKVLRRGAISIGKEY